MGFWGFGADPELALYFEVPLIRLANYGNHHVLYEPKRSHELHEKVSLALIPEAAPPWVQVAHRPLS